MLLLGRSGAGREHVTGHDRGASPLGLALSENLLMCAPRAALELFHLVWATRCVQSTALGILGAENSVSFISLFGNVVSRQSSRKWLKI